MSITLYKMTKELAREYHRGFQYDPDIFMDMGQFSTYVYSEQTSDAQYERQIRLGREYLAVMLDDAVIGEIIFKEMDRTNHHCTLSIHLQNDSVKNQGFGTQAEQLALAYAFDILGMEIVYADAVVKNKRSQHVLEKVGFEFMHSEGIFRYYKCYKDTWTGAHQ